MGLGGPMRYLVGFDLFDDVNQAGGISQVAVVQDEITIRFVGTLVNMIDPIGVEQRGSPLDAMNLIPLLKQKFCQILAVLPGDSVDQRFLVNDILSLDKEGVTEVRAEAIST